MKWKGINETDSMEPEKNSDQQPQQPRPHLWRIFVNGVVEAVAHAQNSYQKKRQAQKTRGEAAEPMSRYEKGSLWVNFLILVSLLFYTQYSREQAIGMREQLRLTETALHLQTRAWVLVAGDEETPALVVGEPLAVTLSFVNSGASPAWRMQSHTTSGTMLPDGKPPACVFRESGCAKTRIVGSISNLGAGKRHVLAHKTRPMTTEAIDAIETERVRLFVAGWVRYFDIFNECHKLRYCINYMPVPEPAFTFCRGSAQNNSQDRCEE